MYSVAASTSVAADGFTTIQMIPTSAGHVDQRQPGHGRPAHPVVHDRTSGERAGGRGAVSNGRRRQADGERTVASLMVCSSRTADVCAAGVWSDHRGQDLDGVDSTKDAARRHRER